MCVLSEVFGMSHYLAYHVALGLNTPLHSYHLCKIQMIGLFSLVSPFAVDVTYPRSTHKHDPVFLHFVIPLNADFQECEWSPEQIDYFEKWKELVVYNLPLESAIGKFFFKHMKYKYEFWLSLSIKQNQGSMPWSFIGRV